eukprot:1520673-Amphidinium_carterae.1
MTFVVAIECEVDGLGAAMQSIAQQRLQSMSPCCRQMRRSWMLVCRSAIAAGYFVDTTDAVSYTHLTLPTILLV